MEFEFDFNASIFGPAFFESEIWPTADVLVSGSERGTTPTPHLDVYGVADHLDRLSSITFALSEYTSPDGSALSTSDTLTNLQQVFSQARVVKHIEDYFRGWHRNCPVIHRPSFRISEVDDVLLVGVILLGAMYSTSQKERSMASMIMAYGEEFIFRAVSSVAKGKLQNLGANGVNEDFQIVQAGFCMAVVQFWTGDAEAKQRAMTTRFLQVIEAAHCIDMFKAAHQLDDRISERKWLLKEAKVRTAAWLSLLDCAFLFFRGIPTRILTSEIMYGLPCVETVFEAEHPFALPQFSFCRAFNSQEAFQRLFFRQGSNDTRILDLTVLDTFILIHMLYRYTSDVLSLSLCRAFSSESEAFTTDIRYALDTWHKCWKHLKTHAQQQNQWDGMGFWRNGDQYETAIRLLLTQSGDPELRLLLGSHVDRLDLLKRLTMKRPPV
ncbi:uncharacterized protein RHO25_013063 [Cercospora beticola]|uniref:Xylanolytic transcriptional activator regulatory domain-containing protein n=1 Tax=Cercospora beticola TaxID=122368 RepID=A0ABZ0P913_CERBT|nr:hypothetical protein RHO25_013063 [Cercospora beticola]CAK1367706.1 unnamed protein product [Cercospora beticola]